MTAIHIIEERAPYLLIEHRGAFAVVERRAGKLYPLRDGEREPEPLSDEGAEQTVGAEGWSDEESARETFDEVTARYKRLAERIW